MSTKEITITLDPAGLDKLREALIEARLTHVVAVEFEAEADSKGVQHRELAVFLGGPEYKGKGHDLNDPVLAAYVILRRSFLERDNDEACHLYREFAEYCLGREFQDALTGRVQVENGHKIVQ